MDYIQINCYEREAQVYFEALIKTLTQKIARIEMEQWNELSMQWARIGYWRQARLLSEARLSLDRIREMNEVEAIHREAEHGFQASMDSDFAQSPYNVIPYQEQVLINYRSLIAAFSESAELGYQELEKQQAWLKQEAAIVE